MKWKVFVQTKVLKFIIINSNWKGLTVHSFFPICIFRFRGGCTLHKCQPHLIWLKDIIWYIWYVSFWTSNDPSVKVYICMCIYFDSFFRLTTITLKSACTSQDVSDTIQLFLIHNNATCHDRIGFVRVVQGPRSGVEIISDDVHYLTHSLTQLHPNNWILQM